MRLKELRSTWCWAISTSSRCLRIVAHIVWVKERKTVEEGPQYRGGQDSSQSLIAQGPSKSTCCAIVTAPGLNSTYGVPLTSSSQSVFSAGWYLQEGLVQLEPIVFTACVFCLGKLEVHDPTTLSAGALFSRGQAESAFLPKEGLGLEKFPLHTLHEGSWAP